jgi:hypothetical protein
MYCIFIIFSIFLLCNITRLIIIIFFHYNFIMKGVLFYSTDCETCRNLWNIMEKTQFLQYFEKINIDKVSLEHLQSLNISKVPAMIISYPNGQKNLLIADQIFKWLTDLDQNRKASMMEMTNSNRVKILEKNKMINNSGIVDFSTAEMAGSSDDYAYLATDVAQPKNFLPCGQEQSQVIMTYNEGSKLSKDEINKFIRNREGSRTQQDEHIKQTMKQEQLGAIYDNHMIQ